MATTTAATTPTARRIPVPDEKHEPRKINVYEQMQHANTQLVPLFPYYGPGAIVYSGAIFHGGPDYDVGHFFHDNTVHEVSFVWGAAGGLIETGRIMATPNLHGVNSFLRDPHSPENFLLITICQRQTDQPQSETLVWRCSECHEHLLAHEYNATPIDEGEEEDRYPAFPTINESVEPVDKFNSDESVRTCPKCGHVNDPFPMDRWGWKQWANQQRTVNDARNALLEKASDATAVRGE